MNISGIPQFKGYGLSLNQMPPQKLATFLTDSLLSQCHFVVHWWSLSFTFHTAETAGGLVTCFLLYGSVQTHALLFIPIPECPGKVLGHACLLTASLPPECCLLPSHWEHSSRLQSYGSMLPATRAHQSWAKCRLTAAATSPPQAWMQLLFTSDHLSRYSHSPQYASPWLFSVWSHCTWSPFSTSSPFCL